MRVAIHRLLLKNVVLDTVIKDRQITSSQLPNQTVAPSLQIIKTNTAKFS
jgi:hypothetical protein